LSATGFRMKNEALRDARGRSAAIATVFPRLK
jgi:hypothetical protein